MNNHIPPLSTLRELTPWQCIEFRDHFRAARALAQGNAEDFHDLLFALERFGYFLCRGEKINLGGYGPIIIRFAQERTSLCPPPTSGNACHLPVDVLFDMVKDARNDALHQGAFARHLTCHATELVIILEDALMAAASRVGDYMVRGPVEAQLWQPLSFIRQTMLSHSFSFLPVKDSGGSWRLISDRKLAVYLRPATLGERKVRLAQSLEHALAQGVTLESPTIVLPTEPISSLLGTINGLPILVVEQGSGGVADRLVGIVTPFDLL